MKRILAGLKIAYTGLLFVSMTCIVILIFLQVIARYVFNSPFSWTEEITLFAFCWLTFSGSAIACYENNHLEVDFFYNRLPPIGKKILQALIYIVSIGLGVFMVADALMTMGRQKGMRSVAARLPIGLYTVAVVIGFIGMTIFCVAHLFMPANITKSKHGSDTSQSSAEV